MQTVSELTTPLPADLPATIRSVKQQLRRGLGAVRGAFEFVAQALRDEVATVAAEGADSGTAVPVVEYGDIAAGVVPAERVRAIRRRGCVVVRGTFERAEAESWDEALVAYLEVNDFFARYQGPADQL